jgi:hypothetical protein
MTLHEFRKHSHQFRKYQTKILPRHLNAKVGHEYTFEHNEAPEIEVQMKIVLKKRED